MTGRKFFYVVPPEDDLPQLAGEERLREQSRQLAPKWFRWMLILAILAGSVTLLYYGEWLMALVGAAFALLMMKKINQQGSDLYDA